MSSGSKWALILGVTGGSGSAIGKAVAAEAGLNVFGVHRGNRPDDAEQVRQSVEAGGQQFATRLSGAGTEPAAKEGANEILEKLGPKSIRLFVHAIADASYGVFLGAYGHRRLEPHHFQKTFETMANSFVYWIRELVDRDLLADGAVMLGLTNPMMDSVAHGWGMVAAAKEALRVYTGHMAEDLGQKGYSVALLKYGVVPTKAVRMAFDDDGWKAFSEALVRETPARRLCTAEEVGSFVAYLARAEATWFNGSTIDFAGGQMKSLLDLKFNPFQD